MVRHKKRSSARTKPGPSLAPSPSVDPSPPDEKMNVIEDLERAVAAVHGGDLSTALKIIINSISRYPESAALHSTRGGIHFQLASQTRDSAAQVQHLRMALFDDRRALQLAPKSISFARYHALALFELAQNDAAVGYDYDAVIQACERALLLDNPTDPVEDLLGVGGMLYVDNPSPVNRIEQVKKKLVKLMEESKKNKKSVLGHGDEEDKFEQLVDDKSLSEIKDEIESLRRRKKEIIEPCLQNALYSPDDRQRLEENRKYKNLQKVVSKVDIISRARPYWNDAMNFEDKKELLKIEIEELKAHFDRNKLAMAKEVLMEAIDFAKAWKFWKFWECCCCGDRFLDGESNVNHITNAHLEKPLPDDLRSLVPVMVSEAIADVLDQLDAWKPVDSTSAAEIMENMSSEDLKSVKLPYCDDSRRMAIINSIRVWLRWFITGKLFATSLLRMLQKLTISTLKVKIQKPVLKDYTVHRPLLLICFLEVPELNSLLECLQNLARSCGLRSVCETTVKAGHGFCERIVFSSDFSCLLFDERCLRGEIGEPDDGSAVTSHGDNDEAEEVIITHGDDFVNWLWNGGRTIGEQLKEWTSTREASKSQGMMFFKILEREYDILQHMCNRKWEILRYEKPLLNLKNIYLEENEKREEISGYEPQSYRSLLLNRQRKLEMEGDSVMDSSSFELHMILSILKEAHIDTDIKEKIKKKRHRMDLELYTVDAIIMTNNAAVRQTGLKLEIVTVRDYRSIMVPLLKSLMQARLQDQVDKDASEKSKAATEALLAELALDAEKNTNRKGGFNLGLGLGLGQGQGKSKGKKKKQYYKKAKDSKATGGGKEQRPPHPENVEQAYFSAGHGGNDPNLEIGVPVSTDELKQREEELRLEADVRMLDEVIEFQRKIENEAKQNRLAELNKSTRETSEAGEDVGSSEQQACFSAGHGGNYPNLEIGVLVSTGELKQREEELSSWETELDEELERKAGEALQRSFQMVDEATQRFLSEQNDGSSAPAISFEVGEDVGSCEQQKQQPRKCGPISLHLTEAEPVVSSEVGEDVGSSEQQQQTQSGLVSLDVAESVPVVSYEAGEDVGSSEQRQQRQSEQTPLNAVKDVTIVSFEASKDVGSSEQQSEQTPLNVAEDVPTVSSEGGEDHDLSEHQHQQQQKRSGPIPLNVVEGVPAVSSEAGEDVGSSDGQQQKRQSGVVMPLPFSGIRFGTIDLPDIYQAESIKLDKKSSEPEQLRQYEAPDRRLA